MAFEINSDRVVDGVPLRERYERFCVRFVECRNDRHAYRTAFVVDPKKLGDWVEEQARKLMSEPLIAARIQELRDAAASVHLTGMLDLMRDYHDIIVADPNEIISYARENCRFCYGEEHRYQWISADEYTNELARILKSNSGMPADKQEPLPDVSGGFGFDPTRDPLPHCPACFGQGTGRVLIHDTRKLSLQARKLYEGVKETAGGIEIKMADKHKAREMLGKMLGVFKEGAQVIPVAPATTRDDKPVTVHDAAKTYLRVIQGGKAA